MTAKVAIDQIMPVMRPYFSAIQPKNKAPSNCPRKPDEMRNPICGGVSFQICTIAGRIEAIASASNASKKVATPIMMRVLTCHQEIGRRSTRATISSALTACARTGINRLPTSVPPTAGRRLISRRHFHGFKKTAWDMPAAATGRQQAANGQVSRRHGVELLAFDAPRRLALLGHALAMYLDQSPTLL